MSQNVLHFQCAACQSSLTVPIHLAGVTGPCPKCGATVTSPQAPVPAPEPLAVPPMPSMMPPVQQQAPPPMQQPVATIPQPQSYPAAQQEPAAGGWGSPALPPQQPVAHIPQPQQAPVSVQSAPEMPVTPTSLPPRRQPGQPPVGGSLMNQQGLAGFGPVGGGMTAPSQAPQWNLPTAPEIPPMPERPVEDPMTTILLGTNAPTTSELDNDPRNLRSPGGLRPALEPAPVSMPPQQAMNVRLGGPKRRGGKVFAALAALLLVGALGGAGWYFQEPIKELVARYFPSSPEAEDDIVDATPEITPPEPTPTEAAPPSDPVPFDPLAKPTQGLPVEQPKPIIVQNAPPSALVTPTPAASGGITSSILGPTTPQPPPTTEVKLAEPPDVPPVTMPPVPAVPKATIVVDDPAETTPPSAKHVPGTAIGKKESAPEPLVEIAPAKPLLAAPSTAQAGTTATADMTREVIVQATPESQKAADSLKAFFAAKNLSERMPLTLGSENMKSLMERYYAKKDSGAIEVDEIKLLRYDPAPDTGGGPHCVFTVASRLWEHPLPIMLQEEGGSYKVDWLAFVEFRDNLLFEFLSDFQEMPARFHVGIRRTHYFEDDVPNLSEKDCFEIQPPLPTYVGYVFVPKNTPLARDLASRLSWETLTAYVIVELRWKRLGEMKWVELTAVPQLNWYSFPQMNENEKSPAASAPAPKKGSGGVDIKKLK